MQLVTHDQHMIQIVFKLSTLFVPKLKVNSFLKVMKMFHYFIKSLYTDRCNEAPIERACLILLHLVLIHYNTSFIFENFKKS